MPRPPLGPRLWFDRSRDTWVIRDGFAFIRTGTEDRAQAEAKLNHYLMFGGPVCEAYPLYPTKGFVYFVSTDDIPAFPVKIGWTERIARIRLMGIQTGCPYRLSVVAGFPGTYQDESGLHRQFKADRLCGEWFKRSPDLMALIEQNRAKEAA
jgi:hypothetical protein